MLQSSSSTTKLVTCVRQSRQHNIAVQTVASTITNVVTAAKTIISSIINKKAAAAGAVAAAAKQQSCKAKQSRPPVRVKKKDDWISYSFLQRSNF